MISEIVVDWPGGDLRTRISLNDCENFDLVTEYYDGAKWAPESGLSVVISPQVMGQVFEAMQLMAKELSK